MALGNDEKSEKNMSVSVVVAVHNEEKHVGRCLETLLEQQTEGFCEVIVVDDGSTDTTVSEVKKQKVKSKEGERLRIFCLPHFGKGPAKARNFGAGKARGEILVFVDGDMEFVDRKFVKKLIKPIVKGRARGTFGKGEYVANWGNAWARCWNYNQNLSGGRRIPEDYPDLGMDFRAILKSEFLRVGGFDDIGYTDTWSLPKKLGYRPVAAPGVKYYHYNPGGLYEVFSQAKWIGGRRFKLGLLGRVVALVRASLPVSLVVGIYKAIKFRELRFVIFKVVYDWGFGWGVTRGLAGSVKLRVGWGKC